MSHLKLRAEEFHDKYAYENGFLGGIKEDGSIVWTNLRFYNKMLNDHPVIIKRLDQVKRRREKIKPFTNLGDTQANLPFDIPYFMNRYERELCKGNDTIVSTYLTIYLANVTLNV